MVVSLSTTCHLGLTLSACRHYKEMKLAGIIYLYNISESQGKSPAYLPMLSGLCGDDALENVVLAVAGWRDITDAKALEREKQLEQKYWKKKIIDHKSTVARFMGTTESAWEIINPILKKPFVDLRIQWELVHEHKPLEKTAAFGQLRSPAK